MIPRNLNLKFLQQISVTSWMVVVIMVGGLLAIAGNLGRVVVNALDDYQVYLEEREGLETLQGQQEDLEKQLAYYESYEYKKLYARDVLNLTQSGEKLYSVNDRTEFYEVRERRQTLVQEDEYARWWAVVLIP